MRFYGLDLNRSKIVVVVVGRVDMWIIRYKAVIEGFSHVSKLWAARHEISTYTQ